MYSLNKEEILSYQQNRDPYLMIDYATEVVPGEVHVAINLGFLSKK